MAVASQAANLDNAPRRFIGLCLAATAVLGLAFLVVKGFEYKEDMAKRDLIPGSSSFPLAAPAARGILSRCIGF